VYNAYHSMIKEPFLNRPTPELFFDSKIHAGAWSFLEAGLHSEESYLLLTGEYGTGKTLLCLRLVEQLKREGLPYVYVSTPMQSYSEVLWGICRALNLQPIAEESDEEALHHQIYRYFEDHRDQSLVILLDDAQEHNAKALNKVRLLANYNLDGLLPIRLFLFASPAFTKRLQAPDLEPLDQRIKRRYEISGLNFIETKEYIYFRLLEAGATGSPYFPDPTIHKIVEVTRGIPRRINGICDMCIQISISRGVDIINRPIVDEATTYLGWQLATLPSQQPNEKAALGSSDRSHQEGTAEISQPPIGTGPTVTVSNGGHYIHTDDQLDSLQETAPTPRPGMIGEHQDQVLGVGVKPHQDEAFPTWAWRLTVVVLIVASIIVIFARDLDIPALLQQLLNQ